MELKKAVTLAAGRGTRMKDLTDDCPKPMLPLGDRPMLAHQLDRMREAGIEQVLIVVGYRADVVKDYFAQNPVDGMTISYVHQETVDGTGSAAKLAREFAAQDPFLLTFGDIIVDADIYRGAIERMEGADIVITLKHVDDPYRGAAVYVEGDFVTKIIEKPAQGTSTTNWNNAGIFAFRPNIFGELDKLEPSPRGEYELTDALHTTLEAGRPIRWQAIEGFWRDIGRPEDLPAAKDFVGDEPNVP